MWATRPTTSITMISFILLIVVAALSEGACPSSWGSPRKDIVCYFSGMRASSTLDACLCTHMVYNSVGLNQEGHIEMSKDALKDLEVFRTQNPSLKVIASLGGKSISADVFSSLVTDKDRLDNLTTSINSYYTDGVINGIEIDWEWPVQDGGKKDRVKLIRYARQIKIAVGEEITSRKRVHKVAKRDLTEEEETSTKTEEEERTESITETTEAEELASQTTPTPSTTTLSSSTNPKDIHKGERVSVSESTSTTTSNSRKHSRTRQTSTQHSLHNSKPRVAEPRTRKFQKADPLKGKTDGGAHLVSHY